jgi:hypothetical protein
MHSWEELESLMTDGISSQGREITIMMSQEGADRYAHAMAIENAVGFVEWMKERKKIEFDIAENLITMLRSPDKENFNIAILAIEQLKK